MMMMTSIDNRPRVTKITMLIIIMAIAVASLRITSIKTKLARTIQGMITVQLQLTITTTLLIILMKLQILLYFLIKP